MTKVILLPPGGGEVIGDSADRRVEILSDRDELHATWSRFGPHREGADLHVHRRHTDVFYVLAGELTVRVGPSGETKTVSPGTLVRVPPLVVHGFRNGSDAELRYLNFHAPGQGFADYLRSLRDGRTLVYDQEEPPADGGRPAGEASVGTGEVVTDRPGLRVTLLADVDEIGIAEVEIAPGGPLPPAAPKPESLYVLEGELLFSFGRAEAGAWVHIPAGVSFTCTVGSEGARFLELHSPGRGFGDALRARLDQEPAQERA